MKVVGIDIGSYSVKVAELDVSSKGYVLSHYFERTLSPDITKDKGLEVIEILRALSAEYDPTNTRFVLGVPQHMVSTHHRRFPFRERPKIQKSLAFELEDEIPLDIDETIFDAKIVEYVGETADVLTIACPKEAVAELVSLAKDGAFDPELITVEGLALANNFEAWDAPPPELSPALRHGDEVTSVGVTVSAPARVVLNIGHKRTVVLVYRESGLVAVRSVMWGGADIANPIARAFSIPFFEAVKVLQTKSFILMNSAGASRDQILMSKTVSEAVDELVRELRLTLLEVRSAFNLDYRQIDLLGGTSQIQNLGPYLTQALEVPANVAHHLARHRQSRVEATAGIEASGAIAIGLAIEGLKRPRNPAVNLRQGEFARENLVFKRLWEKWRVPVQVAASAFALFIVYSMVRDSLSTSMVAAVDTRITEAASKVGLGKSATASTVERHIKAQKVEIKNREILQELDNYTSSMDVLARLSEKLPVGKPPVPGKGFSVHRLIINYDEIVVEGKAEGQGLDSAIKAALGDIARPKSLETAKPGPLPPGPGTPFAYKMKVNRKP